MTDEGSRAGAAAPNCALLTVTKAIALSTSADTITVHGGTYFEAATLTMSSTHALTVQCATGEVCNVRWGRADVAVAGNTAWTAVTAGTDIGGGGSCPVVQVAAGTYISNGIFAGGGEEPFGYVTDVPSVLETGSQLPLITYGDSRANTGGTCDGGVNLNLFCNDAGDCPGSACTVHPGLEGWRHFITTNEDYVDASTGIYVGPGIFGERRCAAGPSVGCLCDRKDGEDNPPSTDCGALDACANTGKVYIRLSKTADMRAFETAYGKVFFNENEDPRNHAIDLSYQSRGIDITTGGVTIKGMNLGVSNKTIDIRCTGTPCSTFLFDGNTIRTGVRAIGVGGTKDNKPASNGRITRNRFTGPYLYWVFWTDYKTIPKPGQRFQPGSVVDFRRGAHDWEIDRNLFRGGFDGIGMANCEYNLLIHDNYIGYFTDDAIEAEAGAVVGDASDPCAGRSATLGAVHVWNNYFENDLTASAPGQSSGTVDGDFIFDHNVVAFLRDAPVNRKVNLRTFNGGQRYGHQLAFKPHGLSSEPTQLPRFIYAYNTVVEQNSGTRGVDVLPPKVVNPLNSDTKAYGNIFAMVNGKIQGTLLTGSPCTSTTNCIGGPLNPDGGTMLNRDLWWRYNASDGSALVDSFYNLPALCSAKGLECQGIGGPGIGSDPRFAGFQPSFIKADPARWVIIKGYGYTPWDFRLGVGSPAINGTNGLGMPNGKGGSIVNLSGFTSTLDMGALPYGTADLWTGVFPFNEPFAPLPSQGKLIGVQAKGTKVSAP